MCLPLLCALLFQHSLCFWSVWCRRAMVPGDTVPRFAEFQGIVSVNDFRLPIGLQELLQAPFGFLRSFHGNDWIHWVAKSCTTTAYRWLSRYSQLSLKTLWSACCYQVTKFFSTRYGSTIASSARGPCNFGPLADLAISVFREMSMNIVFTHILTSLEYGL